MINKSFAQRIAKSLFEGKKVVNVEYDEAVDIVTLTFDCGYVRKVTGVLIREFKGDFYEKV